MRRDFIVINESFVKLNSPALLCSKRHIPFVESLTGARGGNGFGCAQTRQVRWRDRARQLARRLRIPCLAIEINEYTGKTRTLNHTEELDLKARQYSERRVVEQASLGACRGVGGSGTLLPKPSQKVKTLLAARDLDAFYPL